MEEDTSQEQKRAEIRNDNCYEHLIIASKSVKNLRTHYLHFQKL